jgi:DNA-binding NtrC family response regulator
MREVYAVLERATPTDTTILLEGETGTGKGLAAASVHKVSPRRDGPFVVVDCGAIPANLLESELFGHEKGAFTGADARRIGAFEDASGGTIFLDEIGELPLDLQPKLLRVLESRELRRVGGNRTIPVDVRVVAATNRDLRAEVNAGRFRSDLYFRLAVVKVRLPSVRERPEDIPGLVEEFLRAMAPPAEAAARLRGAEFLADLVRHPWPGNVRELRNHLERCLVFQDAGRLPEPEHAAPAPGSSPYADARRRALDEWERSYLDGLLRRFPGKVAQAAAAAGLDRAYLYKLLRKHGLKA